MRLSPRLADDVAAAQLFQTSLDFGIANERSGGMVWSSVSSPPGACKGTASWTATTAAPGPPAPPAAPPCHPPTAPANGQSVTKPQGFENNATLVGEVGNCTRCVNNKARLS